MMKTLSICTIAALALLAACSSNEDPPAVENAYVEQVPVVANEVVAVEAPAAANTTVSRDEVPAPIDQPNEAQMQEDAEATGMTSRLPDRDETAPVAGNASQ